MADCKEVKAALDNLDKKVGDFDKRLRNAEKCCNDDKRDKPINLDAILKRLSDLESAVNKILQYIESLENAIKAALNPLKLLVNLFNIF